MALLKAMILAFAAWGASARATANAALRCEKWLSANANYMAPEVDASLLAKHVVASIVTTKNSLGHEGFTELLTELIKSDSLSLPDSFWQRHTELRALAVRQLLTLIDDQIRLRPDQVLVRQSIKADLQIFAGRELQDRVIEEKVVDTLTRTAIARNLSAVLGSPHRGDKVDHAVSLSESKLVTIDVMGTLVMHDFSGATPRAITYPNLLADHVSKILAGISGLLWALRLDDERLMIVANDGRFLIADFSGDEPKLIPIYDRIGSRKPVVVRKNPNPRDPYSISTLSDGSVLSLSKGIAVQTVVNESGLVSSRDLLPRSRSGRKLYAKVNRFVELDNHQIIFIADDGSMFRVDYRNPDPKLAEPQLITSAFNPTKNNTVFEILNLGQNQILVYGNLGELYHLDFSKVAKPRLRRLHTEFSNSPEDQDILKVFPLQNHKFFIRKTKGIYVLSLASARPELKEVECSEYAEHWHLFAGTLPGGADYFVQTNGEIFVLADHGGKRLSCHKILDVAELSVHADWPLQGATELSQNRLLLNGCFGRLYEVDLKTLEQTIR